MNKETTEEHESYGLLGISHVSHSGPGANLFGSSIRHPRTVQFTLYHAEKIRCLNRNRYFPAGRRAIAVVEMSPNQFAELLTTPNVGSGVPCTIIRLDDKGMEDCPEVDERQIFEREFKEKVQQSMDLASSLVEEVKDIFDTKKNIGKGDREEILGKISRIMMEITANAPFIQSQFNEAVGKTVAEAKGSIDAFVESKIRDLGMEALADQVKLALASTGESPMLETDVVVEATEKDET